MRLLLIFILFVTSCATRKPTLDVNVFSPYVTTYEQKALAQGKILKVTDLTMNFGATNNIDEPAGYQEIGYCQLYPDKAPQIVINPNWWANADEVDRQLLIMHELGHCVQGRQHKNTLDEFGNPQSIMNFSVVPENIYLHNSDYYDHELFWYF